MTQFVEPPLGHPDSPVREAPEVSGPIQPPNPGTVDSPAIQALKRQREDTVWNRFRVGTDESLILNADDTMRTLMRTIANDGIDPDFRVTGDDLEAVAEEFGIDPALRPDFYDKLWMANSPESLRMLAKDFVETTYRNETLSRAGMGGEFLYRGLGALIDAPALALPGVGLARYTTLAGRLGQAIAGTGGRLSRGARIGAATGVATASQEAFLVLGDPTRGAMDIALAGAAGFVLGAPAGALTRMAREAGVSQSSINAASVRAVDDLDQGPLVGQRADVTESVQAQHSASQRLNEAIAKATEIASKVERNLDAAGTRRALQAIAAGTAKASSKVQDQARQTLSELNKAESELRAAQDLVPASRIADEARRRAAAARHSIEAFAGEAGIDLKLDEADLEAVSIPKARAPKPPTEAEGLDSAGAARASDVLDPLVEDRGILKRARNYAGDAKAMGIKSLSKVPGIGKWLREGRIDSRFTLGSSKSSGNRALANALFDEHIGFDTPKGKPFVQRTSAHRRSHQIDAQFRLDAKVAMATGFQQWAKAKGISGWKVRSGQASQEFEEFAEQVGDAIRSRQALPQGPVGDAALAMRRAFEKYLDLGRRVGVFDEGIPMDPHYLPRVFDELKLQDLFTPEGQSRFMAWAKESLRRNNPDLDDATLGIIAKGYWRSIQRSAHGINSGVMHGLNLEDLDVLRNQLDEMGLDDKDIDKLLTTVSKRNETVSKIGQAKRRLDFDETYELDGFSIKSFTESNVDRLMDKYARRVNGAIALKERIGISGTSAERSRLRDEVLGDALESGHTEAEAMAQAKVAEAFVRNIIGMPLDDNAGVFSNHPMSASSRSLTSLRKLNFALYMQQTGFASFAEFGMLLAQGNVGVLMRSVPEFRQFMRDAKTGRVGNEVVDFFESMTGIGAERVLHPLWNRWDDFTVDTPDARTLNRAERALNAAQHVVAEKISGLGPMTRFQRRISMLGMLHQLEKFAYNNRKLSNSQLERLAQMGLRKGDLEVLKRLMNKHQVTLAGFGPGRKVKRSDFEAMAAENPTLIAKLTSAVDREVQRTIIDGDIASSPLFAQSQLGKVLTQFLTFAMNAHTKLTMRGINLHDTQTFLSFTFSMMFASMAYVAQTYVNTIGNEEKRERDLEMDKILKRSVARAGHAALTPGFVDFFSEKLTGEPLLNARVSDRPSEIIAGNPSMVTTGNILQTLDSLRAIWDDDRVYSQEDGRALHALIPVIGKMVGARAAGESYVADLPRYSER